MEGIEKSFGANRVLVDVYFAVDAGETHALLGENGAGKSTLMKVLIGVYTTDSGRIVLDGEDVTALSLRERLDRGIAMIFQELSVLPNRSVAENLFVLREPRAFGWRVDTQRMIAEAQSLIDRYGFGLHASARVGDLGFAQRQMVEILKALSRGAKLLVMDEPTSSLTVREEETLFATVDQLKASGIGIVYISHRMADVLRLSDRISIVKDGRLIGPLLPSETSIAHIASLMSRSPDNQGKSTVPEKAPTPLRAAPSAGSPALSVSGLKTARKLSDVSFDIKAGEIVGLAGLVGSGRSTLAKAIFGLIPDATGAISVAGRPVRTGSVASAVAAKIGFVPEDRRLEGLVANRSLAENFALTDLTALSHAHGLGPMATRADWRALRALPQRPQPAVSRSIPGRARAFGREPAEGRLRKMAGDEPQGAHSRRADVGRRHQREARHARADQAAGCARRRRSPDLFGARGADGAVRPDRRYGRRPYYAEPRRDR